MSRWSLIARFTLLFAAALALPLAVTHAAGGEAVASTQSVAAVPDSAATVVLDNDGPAALEASSVPCAEDSSGDATLNEAVGPEVPNFSAEPTAGPPGGRFRGYCRCGCSLVRDCNTSADCGGGLCLKGPTCC
jgi:hypothetical protein